MEFVQASPSIEYSTWFKLFEEKVFLYIKTYSYCPSYLQLSTETCSLIYYVLYVTQISLA